VPKIVDHDARRHELMDSAWRVIARYGVNGATLREIAAEAGFANGALKPYFPTKRDLLLATYSHVFERTNDRVRAVVAQRDGLGAVLAFGREVLPLDAERLDEARVVIAFWQEALLDRELAAANARSVQVWREWITGWLEEASSGGRLRDGLRIPVAVQTLLSFLLGSQVSACLDSGARGGDALQVQLEALVDSWRLTHGDRDENLRL
jgi:AcrR family transcriptional regulator